MPAFHALQRVPGKREVDLYVRTYTTLLQSSGAVPVSSLIPAHITAASTLHAGAEEETPDLNAFIYSAQRLPECIVRVSEIVLGQSTRGFRRAGYFHLESWEVVAAPGRRRRWRYNGGQTLVATIASASDLDDLIPTIVAYQIEWNKLHGILAADQALRELVMRAALGQPLAASEISDVGKRLLLQLADWQRLQSVWGASLWTNLAQIAENRKRFTVRMIGGSHLGNARATHQWWLPAERALHELGAAERPVFFVSSNTHSIVNVLSGTARRRKDELTAFIRAHGTAELKDELARLEEGVSRSNWDNLLYFAARPYFASPGREASRRERSQEERAIGIHHIEPHGPVDVGIQIIEFAKLDPAQFDPRLCSAGGACLDPRGSEAIIVNVNYPLGLAAYNIMTQVGMTTDELQGVYILGKAATLNGRIGDVMISDVVYDEHSGNTYWFENAFTYSDLAPYLEFGAALDNQKAVTVKGTFLQNEGYLDFFYRENFTVVEMEAGPYLNALYEDLLFEAISLRRGDQPANAPSGLARSGHHPLRLGYAVHAGADAGGARNVLPRHGLDLRIDDRHFAADLRSSHRHSGSRPRHSCRRFRQEINHVRISASEHITPDLNAFESFVRVRFHEVDSLGHVNNAAYLNYLEQAAIDHATYLGLDIDRLRAMGGVFLARRHDIIFLSPAFAGDLLRIVTWLEGPRGARVNRTYRVIRETDTPRLVPSRGAPVTEGRDVPEDRLVVRATTEWVFASPNGMPRRIPAEIVEIFGAGATRYGEPLIDQSN